MARTPKVQGESTHLLSVEEVDTRLQMIQKAVAASTKGQLIDYNPLIEIGKLANDRTVDMKLRADLHVKLAEFIYPKVRTLDFSNPEGKQVKITIEIASYARKEKEVDAEYRQIVSD